MSSICTKCGALLPPGVRFCTVCGAPVPAESAARPQ
ncbi:MAG: zinc ribbon domain-containing protein, partial [Oscillospiraceae bacterium]|nr:zinc ribbon domain-containing protein [Oscillospiraceae bacterium]